MSVRTALIAAGVAPAVAAAEAPLAERAMVEANITTARRARFFLAQCLHESAGLRWSTELADGTAYEGRRDLGNLEPGDGPRFKGRGWIQLTGRSNYRACGRALGLALERRPELAARPDVRWRIAAWYWTQGSSHGNLNVACDRGDFIATTRGVNGGTNGHGPSWVRGRRTWYEKRLRGHDCQPDRLSHLTAVERRRCRELDRLRRERRDPDRRRVLVRELTAQRKRIWRAAQGPGGWGRAHRAARYRSLLART